MFSKAALFEWSDVWSIHNLHNHSVKGILQQRNATMPVWGKRELRKHRAFPRLLSSHVRTAPLRQSTDFGAKIAVRDVSNVSTADEANFDPAIMTSSTPVPVNANPTPIHKRSRQNNFKVRSAPGLAQRYRVLYRVTDINGCQCRKRTSWESYDIRFVLFLSKRATYLARMLIYRQ